MAWAPISCVFTLQKVSLLQIWINVIHTIVELREAFCLMCMWLAGSPLWSKERNEAIVVQMGVSLVLQCRPPAGLPPPVIFWMDNSESFACIHICTAHTRHKEIRRIRQRTNKKPFSDYEIGKDIFLVKPKSNKLFTVTVSSLTLSLLAFQTFRSCRWINGCPRLWTETCTFQMFSRKTAGLTTSATLASLTHKPSSRNSPSQSQCWTVSQDTEHIQQSA